MNSNGDITKRGRVVSVRCLQCEHHLAGTVECKAFVGERRKPDMLAPEDEAVPWDGYNHLSKLVAPATDESLSITDQIPQARASPRSEAAKTWPIVNCIRWDLHRTVYLLMFM